MVGELRISISVLSATQRIGYLANPTQLLLGSRRLDHRDRRRRVARKVVTELVDEHEAGRLRPDLLCRDAGEQGQPETRFDQTQKFAQCLLGDDLLVVRVVREPPCEEELARRSSEDRLQDRPLVARARLLQIADDIVVGQRIRSEHVIDCAIRVELPEKRARLPLELRLVRRSSFLEFHQHRIVRIASDAWNVNQQRHPARPRRRCPQPQLERRRKTRRSGRQASDAHQRTRDKGRSGQLQRSGARGRRAARTQTAGHRRQPPDVPRASRRVARRGSRTTDSCERPKCVFDRCRRAFPDQVVNGCRRVFAWLPFPVFVFDPEDVLEAVRDRKTAILAAFWDDALGP